MTINKLAKILSCFAMSGGALRILCSFAPLFHQPFIAEVLYIMTDLVIIPGLIGVYLAQMELVGRMGFYGFLIAVLGFAFIAGPETELSGMSVYALGTPAIAVGLALLALAQLKSRAVFAAAPLLMLAALACGAIGMVFSSMPTIFGISGILLGGSIALNGWYVYRTR